MTFDLDAIMSAVERVAALGGGGMLVLVIYGFLRGELYTGKQYREMVKDRDFYRGLHFDQTAVLTEQLGGGD